MIWIDRNIELQRFAQGEPDLPILRLAGLRLLEEHADIVTISFVFMTMIFLCD